MHLVPCYLLLPCGIMVVRQILALNVRVRILAGQRENIEQGTRNDEVGGFDVRCSVLEMQHFDVRCSLFFRCYPFFRFVTVHSKFPVMKKVFAAICLLAVHNAFSQKCTDYYYLQNNKTIEMTITNKKAKETGKVVYAISNVSKKGNGITATINSEMFDKNGKTISKGSNNVQCENGVLMMDMKMFIPSAQQEQMGDVSAAGTTSYLEYPSALKDGDALKDASFDMDFKSKGGLGGHISIDMTNRKVEGKENITTPAGTWDCFKITYHSKMILKMGFGIPINADVIEWYAPGFGVVKTESGGGGTEISSIK